MVHSGEYLHVATMTVTQNCCQWSYQSINQSIKFHVTHLPGAASQWEFI